MRRSLGTVLFLVWIYVLLFTVNNYILNYHSNLILSFVLGISSAILLLHLSLINTSQDLSSEYSKCSCGIDCPGKNKDNHQCTLPADRKEVRQNLSNKMKKAIVWLITLTVISTIGTIILCCNITQWGVPGSMIAIIITILNSVAFIIFRECRSHLMYFLGINEKWAKKDPEDTEPLDFENSKKSQNSYERSIIEKDKSQEIPQIWNYNLLRNIGNLSNHIYYLKIMKLAFFIISGTILIIGIFRTTWLNPAIYIIYFFSAITYLLSITAKQFYFYYQKVKDNEDAYNEFKKIDKEHLQRFKFYAPFAFLLPIAIGSFAIIQGNDLHKFKNVKEEQTTLLTLDEFKEDIRQSSIQNCLKNKPIFSLSSFGGGLKANYWTLNVLNELELKSDNAFIKNTLSMSGVSGGAMGLSLHPFIYSKSASNRIRDIDKIGDANILSIDAFYMLFADLIKELIPEFIYKFEGKDRSHKAMSKYNELLCESVEDACKNDFDSLSFRQQWSNFYNDNTYYPALIMNTTSTNRRYGYACSIRGVDFEGGINIVDYKENSKISISYFNASSTVNRFAFMSPAASVPQKGHFVDGGYFENSGLLSTLSFWDKFNGKDSSESSGVSNNLTGPSEYQFHYSNEDSTEVERRPWHVVCLINGKGYWIKNLLEKYSLSHLSLSKSKGSAEIGAIVKTIIGTEMLPTYYIEKMQHELRDRFHPIYMPFMINYQDVENLLGGTPSPIYFDRIKTMIQENNEKIEKALRSTGEEKYNRLAWGIVEPTLARLLSLPDREYQKAMINHHPDLIKDINDVAKLCN